LAWFHSALAASAGADLTDLEVKTRSPLGLVWALVSCNTTTVQIMIANKEIITVFFIFASLKLIFFCNLIIMQKVSFLAFQNTLIDQFMTKSPLM
jgi:hypothetical protein